MEQFQIAVAADLPQGRIDTLARDLGRDLSRSGMRVSPVEAAPVAGERGALAVLGNLLVDGLSGKLGSAALDVLKAYLVRERTLRLKVTRPDGAVFEFDAKNIDSAKAAEFLSLAKKALD